MKITVKAKPGAREEKVEKIADSIYAVSVKERPEKGKANKAIEKALAKYFGVAPVHVEIVSGHSSPHKIVSITR